MTQTAVDDSMLDEEWLAAPRKRSRLRIVLAAVLVASVCFLGGTLVQKHFGATSESTASPGGIPEGMPEGFPGGGFPGGTQPETGDSATEDDDSESVIGTVVEVRGEVWVVEDLGRKRHDIQVSDATDLVKETAITPEQVKVGDRVDVSGANTDGQLQADEVTLR